jgi:Spy/CpxP family protein refolding chaperone
MNIFTNKEAWIWALASLLIITMAILGTMLWQRYDGNENMNQATELKEPTDENQARKGYGRWREKMGFTPEQDIKLKELRDNYRQATRAVFQKLQVNQDLIFKELESDNPDVNKLEVLANETGKLHADLRKETISHMLAIKAVTTHEQYEKMAEMMQQWIYPGHMGRPQQMQQRHGAGHKDTHNECK